jgi:hypothetical protein
MARCVAAIFNLAKRRLIDFAAIDSDGTPCVESTTGRRVYRRRNVTAQKDTLLLRGGIGYRDCPQQCLRVGVFRIGTNLRASSDLY